MMSDLNGNMFRLAGHAYTSHKIRATRPINKHRTSVCRLWSAAK